jgi:hypothetical protein
VKRVYLALLLIVGLLAFTTPATADQATKPGADFALVLNSWPVILAGLVGIGSTHLTELLAHYRAPQWVKSGINLFLATLGATLATLKTVPGATWKDYVGEIFAAVFVSMMTHWTGATAWLQTLTQNQGVGASLRPIVPPPPSKEVVESPLPDDHGTSGHLGDPTKKAAKTTKKKA